MPLQGLLSRRAASIYWIMSLNPKMNQSVLVERAFGLRDISGLVSMGLIHEAMIVPARSDRPVS